VEHQLEIAADRALPPLPSHLAQEVQEAPKKPKLSMKMLHELILELHRENRKLAERLEALEDRLSEQSAARREAAATTEMPELSLLPESGADNPKPEWTSVAVTSLALGHRFDAPKPILPPRSERHPAQKKTFWSLFQPKVRTREIED
jgi:hypothetical protein